MVPHHQYHHALRRRQGALSILLQSVTVSSSHRNVASLIHLCRRLSSRTTTTTTTTTTTSNPNTIVDVDVNRVVGPISQAYRQQLHAGRIQSDEQQLQLALKLDSLYDALLVGSSSTKNNRLSKNRMDDFSYKYNLHQKPPTSSSSLTSSSITTTFLEQCRSYVMTNLLHNTASSLSSRQIPSPLPPCKGLYIYGSVGVGKSFLMDLFHQSMMDAFISTTTTTTTTTTILNENNNKNKEKKTADNAKVQEDDEEETKNNNNNHFFVRRVHFHDFMLDVHQRIHYYKQEHPKSDPIPPVALALAVQQQQQQQHDETTRILVGRQQLRLLCLDEFQVTDIADAMILKRILELLIHEFQVVLVTTSNRGPESLYQGGINRDRFVPFLHDTLYKCMEVVKLCGSLDYRRRRHCPPPNPPPNPPPHNHSHHHHLVGDNITSTIATTVSWLGSKVSNEENFMDTISSLKQCYFLSTDPTTPESLNTIFNRFGGGGSGGGDLNDDDDDDDKQEQGKEAQLASSTKKIKAATTTSTTTTSTTLSVPMGRSLFLSRTNAHCAWMTFDELCRQPLGFADYLVLCQRFSILVVTNIPPLNNTASVNEARRFVTLIDALYETKTKLVASLDVPLEQLLLVVDRSDDDDDDENNDNDDTVMLKAESTNNGKDQKMEIRVTKDDDDDDDDDDNNHDINSNDHGADTLFVKGEGGSSSSASTTMIRTKEGGEVEWSATGRMGVSLAPLSMVRDVSFSVQRCASRLNEMKQPTWGRIISQQA
jgi:predicted ATPase